MRMLITGGNGFIGANLCKHLLMQGHSIAIASRNSFRLIDVLNQVTFYETSDVGATHKDELQEFCPDVIVDCAWDGGNSYQQVNGLNQFRSNILRCINLLETSNEMKHKPMYIGLGSFAEYGIITKKAVETQLEEPVTHYGLAKKTVKDISKMFCLQNEMNWSWLRPCYVYGFGDVPTRLIPKVIEHSLAAKPLSLNDCQVTIDYLHISDFCAGVASVIEKKMGGVFNICSGQEYQLLDIIGLIQNETGTNTITHNQDLDRKFSSKYICGSNDRIKTETGWKPVVEMRKGIIDIIEQTRFSIKD